MTKRALISICVLFFSFSVFCQSISAGTVNAEGLKRLLDPAFSEYARVEGEDLIIEVPGITLCVKADNQNAILSFYTPWKIDNKVSEKRLTKVLNKWNAEYGFVTAYSPNYEEIMLSYHMSIYGGINFENFNATVDMIFKLSNQFTNYLSSEDII